MPACPSTRTRGRTHARAKAGVHCIGTCTKRTPRQDPAHTRTRTDVRRARILSKRHAQTPRHAHTHTHTHVQIKSLFLLSVASERSTCLCGSIAAPLLLFSSFSRLTSSSATGCGPLMPCDSFFPLFKRSDRSRDAGNGIFLGEKHVSSRKKTTPRALRIGPPTHTRAGGGTLRTWWNSLPLPASSRCKRRRLAKISSSAVL